MRAEEIQWANDETFGAVFKREREKQGHTRHYLASRVRATEREVHDWETGKAFPKPHHLSRLFKIMPTLQARAGDTFREPPRPETLKASVATIGEAVALKLRKAAPTAAPASAPASAPVQMPFEKMVENMRAFEAEREEARAAGRYQDEGSVVVDEPLPGTLPDYSANDAEAVTRMRAVAGAIEAPVESEFVASKVYGTFDARVAALAAMGAPEGSSVTLTPADTKQVDGKTFNVYETKVDEPAPASEPASKAPPPAAESPAPLHEIMKAMGERIPFAAALRAMRRANNLRQVDLAELIGVEQSSVGCWEQSDTVPIEAHYAALVSLFPTLAEAEVPRARAISKPVGNLYGPKGKTELAAAQPSAQPPAQPPAPPTPQIPALTRAAVVHASADTFARAKKIARALAKVGPMDAALVAALRELHDQGCTIADVLEWLDEGGNS